jgi:Type II secretion system (T2SS), protein E, N-terminal domain
VSSMNGEGEAPRSSWQRPDAPLGTLIFREGLLSAEQLEDALGESVKRGKRLGQVLVERGLLQESQVARILARQKGLDYVDLAETAVDPAAAALLSSETAWLTHAIPIAIVDGTPLVAVEDPGDEESMRTVAEALGTEPRFAVATRTDILRALGGTFPETGAAPRVNQAPVAPAPVQAVPQVSLPASEPVAAPSQAPVVAEASGLRVAPPPEQPTAAEAEPVAETPASEPEPASSEPPAEVSAAEQAPPAEAPEEAPPAAESVPPPAVPEPSPVAEAPPAPAPTPVAEASASPVPAPADPPEQAEPVVEVPLPAEATQATVAQDAPSALPEPAPAPPEPAPVSPEPAPAPVVVEFRPAAPAAPAAQDPPPASEPPPLEVVPSEPEPEIEPAPEPDPEPVPAAEASPAAPAPIEAGGHRVVVRLSDGGEVEVGFFASVEEANGAAKLLARQIGAAAPGEWPHLGGRFVRPDLIVSVDVL